VLLKNPADSVQQWDIDKLIPYARNARTHSEDQVAQIAASIKEWGWTTPILVDPDGQIIAGHGRVMAARKLNISEIPVMVADGWTDAQKRAYILADNKLALNAGWDEELLALELSELKELGSDLELIGFGDQELADLLQNGIEGLTDPDEVPEVQELEINVPGDLWQLGPHKLLCGDSTVLTDVEKLMGEVKADMCFTDPPYNVDYGNSAKDKIRGKDRRIMNDALGDNFYQFLVDACVNILTVTKGACYLCMSSSELHNLQRAWIEAGGKWSTFIIWSKNTFTLGRSDYQRQYEPILYGWKEGVDHFWCGDRNQSDIWNYNKPHKNDLHPTMKPVELVERGIRNSSKTQDIVFEPFGGGGSTLIACERTGRIARVIELDPKYCDVIIRRWQDFTGQKATLVADGRTFEEVENGRQKNETNAA
jgi:DNA modification methylase